MRRFLAITVLLMAAVLTTAGPVSASYLRNTSVQNVWLTIGAFGSWADFFATWKVTTRSDGTSTITNFQTESVVRIGDQCSPEYCVDWTDKATITYLKANGDRIGDPIPLPNAQCYGWAYPEVAKVWVRCRSAATSLPASAAKVNIRWVVTVERLDGWRFSWIGDKTVSIF